MKYAHLKSGTDIRGVAGGKGITFDAPITLTPEIAEQCAGAFALFLQEKYGKKDR